MSTYDDRLGWAAEDAREEREWSAYWEARRCRRDCCAQLPLRRVP